MSVGEAQCTRWWVIPVARFSLRSGLSYEDMHSRLESLFDTDDRIIAEYVPSLPPRRPFVGSARFGEVRLTEQIEYGNRRRRTLLVASGRVATLPAGSRVVLWFRPPAFTFGVLTLILLWTPFLALRTGGAGATGVGLWTFALVYLVTVVDFWWRALRAVRVVRRAFNA